VGLSPVGQAGILSVNITGHKAELWWVCSHDSYRALPSLEICLSKETLDFADDTIQVLNRKVF